MISLANLAEFPQFIRFNNVLVETHYGSQTIAQKCQLFDGCLKSIVALSNSKEIYFVCFVDEKNPTQFKDHLSLVNYLQNAFLTICNSSNRYVFDCYSRSDKDGDTINVIASILRMPQIVRCLDVSIKIWYFYDSSYPTQLPIEAINQWINQESKDRIDAIAQNGQ